MKEEWPVKSRKIRQQESRESQTRGPYRMILSGWRQTLAKWFLTVADTSSAFAVRLPHTGATCAIARTAST
jgi:hypothetical protein